MSTYHAAMAVVANKSRYLSFLILIVFISRPIATATTLNNVVEGLWGVPLSKKSIAAPFLTDATFYKDLRCGAHFSDPESDETDVDSVGDGEQESGKVETAVLENEHEEGIPEPELKEERAVYVEEEDGADCMGAELDEDEDAEDLAELMEEDLAFSQAQEEDVVETEIVAEEEEEVEVIEEIDVLEDNTEAYDQLGEGIVVDDMTEYSDGKVDDELDVEIFVEQEDQRADVSNVELETDYQHEIQNRVSESSSDLTDVNEPTAPVANIADTILDADASPVDQTEAGKVPEDEVTDESLPLVGSVSTESSENVSGVSTTDEVGSDVQFGDQTVSNLQLDSDESCVDRMDFADDDLDGVADVTATKIVDGVIEHEIPQENSSGDTAIESIIIESDDEAASRNETITDEMREILINTLSYASSEVDVMKPNVASAVVSKMIRRPPNGMPDNWSVTGVAPKPSKEEAISVKPQRRYGLSLQKITSKVLIPCLGVAVTAFLFQSGAKSASSLLNKSPSIAAPQLHVSESSSLAPNDDDLLEEDADITVKPEVALIAEASKDVTPAKDLDETWLDKLITYFIETLASLFR